MALKTIRVRARGRATLLARDSRGNLIPGRFIGRDRKGEILAEGVAVEATSDVLRALQRGDLELVADAPASTEPTDAPAQTAVVGTYGYAPLPAEPPAAPAEPTDDSTPAKEV
jgi:hypothetical protein